MHLCELWGGVTRRKSFVSAAVMLLLLVPVPVRVFGHAVSLAPSASAQTAPAHTGTTEAGTEPQYPGIGPSDEKVEGEMGAYRVRLYGTILLNGNVNDGAIFGQDLPLWAVSQTGNFTFPDGTVGRTGDNHDLVLSLRQSVVGFTVNPAQPPSGWAPSGLVEIDFFGSRPVDTVEPLNRVLNQPRLRKAYFQIEKNGVKFLFGQDNAILAPLDPISLSHVAMPLGATAGDLWGWLPQARVEWLHKTGGWGWLLQGGILRPSFGDPRVETLPVAGTSVDTNYSGLGERSGKPFWEGRVAAVHGSGGSATVLGFAGHYGTEKVGVDRDLKSWAFAFDGSAPIGSHIVLRGEAFKGSNLIPFQGGIQQGAAVQSAPVATNPPLLIREIDTKGGWGEITYLPTTSGKNAVYFGVGTDKPDKDTLLPGSTRVENTFIWLSYFRRLAGAVTVAAEWSNWHFETVPFVGAVAGPTNPASVANAFNVSLAFQF